MSVISYQRARSGDIPVLAAHHRLMFVEMRERDGCCGPGDGCCGPSPGGLIGFPTTEPGSSDQRMALLEQAQREKLERQFGDDTCRGWLAREDSRVVASGCVSFPFMTPVPEDPCPEVGFIHSIYTLPAMRGQGIGTAILTRLLDECRGRGIRRVQLNASAAARASRALSASRSALWALRLLLSRIFRKILASADLLRCPILRHVLARFP